MNIAAVRSNLSAIKSFCGVIEPIQDTLQRIRFDKRYALDPGAEIVALLDFRDLHRYLHPLLDYTAYQSPDQFAAEQVGLEYLFSRPPFQLYLLNEYLEEYRMTLRKEHISTSGFALATDDDIRKRFVTLSKHGAKLLKRYIKTSGDSDISTVARQDAPLLDYLFDDVRTEVLQNGVREFRSMLDKGVIKDASRIPGLAPDDLSLPVDSDFQVLFDRLQQVRPRSKKPNETDARAFWLALHLNKDYHFAKKRFLFVTSARSAIEAFDAPDLADFLDDDGLREVLQNTSIIRTPEYFLLRFFLESPDFASMGLSPSGFSSLISRYFSVTTKLEDYFDRTITISDLESSEFVISYNEAVEFRQSLAPYVRAIAEFGRSLSRSGSLYDSISRRLKLPNVLDGERIRIHEVRDRISDAIKDPRVIVKHFSSTAQKLNDAISELEQGLVPLMYGSGEKEFIYAVHTHRSSDENVQLIANYIVELLARRDEGAFSKAFEKLSYLRSQYPNSPDTNVLASKVYRSVRAYRDALEFASAAVREAPDYSEAQFELALCYRKIAAAEVKNVLLQKSWEHCMEAEQLDNLDARIAREKVYLFWLAVEGKWTGPPEVTDPRKELVGMARQALQKALAMGEKNDSVTITVQNDLAYFLALENREDGIEESLELVNQALEVVDRKNTVLLSAFQDTKGFALMQKYLLTDPSQRDSELLFEAAKYIRDAYQADKTNETRRHHFEDVMDLVLQVRLASMS